MHDELALEDPQRVALLQVDGHDLGTVRVLAGIAPALWRAAAGGATLDELTAAAVAAFGEPDGADPGSLVADAVADLVEAGVLLAPSEWSVREDVAWTDSGDRIVALALSQDSAAPLALEGSAAVIWRALVEGPASAEGITARAAVAAGIGPDEIAQDVSAFLESLETAALAERALTPARGVGSES